MDKQTVFQIVVLLVVLGMLGIVIGKQQESYESNPRQLIIQDMVDDPSFFVLASNKTVY